MPGQPFTQVDAFADRPFGGNPAAVCLLSVARNTTWMQQVAAEMNLAATAFLIRQPDGFGLRWFTPIGELDLCGHATLASAHALWECGQLPPEAIARFHTRSGVLTAEHRARTIWLDFPATPATAAPAPAGLSEALGAPPGYVGRTQFDYLVELESEAVLRALEPDLARLAKLPVRGIIVTATSTDPARHFVSRFFAPAAGIPEDSVTGSAHCALGPFWGERLGVSDLVGYQASRRGGTVRARLAGDRVHLGGQAVTVLRGELLA
jgi:PhzF family phenazine biosynthesis protein